MSQRRLPAEVYWRRRLLVLALILLLAWFATRAFGSEAKPDKPVATTPTATPTKAARVIAPLNGEVTVNLATDAKPCDPEKVRVSPSVKSGQYVGDDVDVSMIVSTTQKNACVLDAKKADLLVVISANKNPVWDSSVCKTALLTKPVAVSPRWSTVAAATWTGRGSGKDCSDKQGFASPGTYVIKSATLGGEPGQATFRLVNKPKPKPKPTETTATPSEKPTD
ncbi:MAG: hypothetical protein M3Q98_05065 [Actinomycetota bacterium]|nr:hypothetical protein [Actinomycetota bacterium]